MRRWWLQACTGCGGCRRAWAWLQAGDDCCRRAASSPLASQRRSRCTDGRPSSSFAPPCDQVRLPPPPSIPSLEGANIDFTLLDINTIYMQGWNGQLGIKLTFLCYAGSKRTWK